MNITINPSDTITDLCRIIQKHNSDKGGEGYVRHQYTKYYYNLFNSVKNDTLRIFEMGVGTYNNTPYNMGPNCNPGASLKAWSEFFPNSKIYGADIDSTILFETNRIKTFYCNQLDKISVSSLWGFEDLQEEFDIIIDDGCHEIDANVIFFENSIHKLKKNGFYIIEDTLPEYETYWITKLNEWKQTFNLNTNYVKIDNPLFPPFDVLIVIQKQ